MSWGWGEYGDYVSVDDKRRRAEAAARKLEKKGHKLTPARLTGRALANTFWGKAWNKNLESYRDYDTRLPRGRSYLRHGSVIDLQIERGAIAARVVGSDVYEVDIQIVPLDQRDWDRLKRECAGQVGSLMDLLRGKLAGPVMEIITRKDDGLFPKPREIHLECSCPDYADMCKHVAATLYGVGARLDESPELLFTLRGVDHLELIAETTQNLTASLTTPTADDADTLDAGSLSEVFGIELEPAAAPAAKKLVPPRKKTKTPARRPVAAAKKRPGGPPAAKVKPVRKPSARKVATRRKS